MELVSVNQFSGNGEVQVPVTKESSAANFMQANTEVINPYHLREDCIIPSFAKDNETTISHAEFIDVIGESALRAFPRESILEPAIRVSHPIKGRIPSAMGKAAKDLLEHEKTLYFERMAFAIEVPTISSDVNGNPLSLTIVGVRSYNLENLHGKKHLEKFKLAIGFKNKVCTNMCISSDGFMAELKVGNLAQLAQKAWELFSNFNHEQILNQFNGLGQHVLSEHQFAQMIGKMRLHQFLPAQERIELGQVPITDSQLATVARDYYGDKSFCRDESGDINLWKLYNLFTGANKSSYIDTFLDRDVACLNFSLMLQTALNGSASSWFIE